MGFFVLFGLVLALFNAIWILTVKFTGAAVGTVVVYGSVGFTALLERWIYKEPLGLPKITALIFSLCGCILVVNAYDPELWKANPLAITVGLFSGLLYAIYSLMGKRTARLGINSWTALLYSFGFAVLFLLIFNLFPVLPGAAGSVHALLPALPVQGWLILMTLAFLPTLLGFGLYITSMKYLSASVTNLIATLEPVMTAIQAYLLLGEQMTLIQILGAILIVTAVVVLRLLEGRRKEMAVSPV